MLIWDGYTNFGDTLFEPINSRKVEKEKLNFCINVKNWELFSKLNIESELTKTVNETKNYHSTFLCFCQCSDKKVGISCSELSTILKNLPLSANHDGVSGWPSTWHNSSNAQIRALDQPLIKDEHSRKIHNCMTGNVKEPDLSLIFF